MINEVIWGCVFAYPAIYNLYVKSLAVISLIITQYKKKLFKNLSLLITK